MRSVNRDLIVALVIACICTGSCLGASWYVPGDYPDLRTAYEAAGSHDTIIVRPGYYAGDNWTEIFFFDKPVKVVSEGGPAVTTLDGRGIDRGLHFRDLYDDSMLVEGFTITNCVGEFIGAVTFHENSSGTLRNCIIENCRTTAQNQTVPGEGGGLRIWGSSPVIENVTIRDCHAEQGGGCNILVNSAPIFRHLTIENCTGGALMASEYCDPYFEDCRFINNQSSHISHVAGVGVYLGGSGHFVRCVFQGNNNVDTNGGGIHIGASDTVFDHCMFIDNISQSLAAGIMCHNGATPTFNYCTIAGNSAAVNGDGIGVFGGSHAVFNDCIIWQPGSEIYSETGGTATFNNCNISTAIGAGNFSDDPGFTDAMYHIASDSPCIDRGRDSGVRMDFEKDWVEDPAELWDVGADEVFTATPGTVTFDIILPGTLIKPGDLFSVDAVTGNDGSGIAEAALIVVLDVYGEYFMWPGWDSFLAYDQISIPNGKGTVSILPRFIWPQGVGSASSIYFHGGIMSSDLTALISNVQSVEFGWTE